MNTDSLLSLRRQIIEKNYSRLNNMQLEAVTTVNGPLLILAGAGSGKTTVIVNRIASLIKYGNAYNSEKIFTGFIDDPEALLRRYLDGDTSVYEEIKGCLSVDAPKPWQILAITFTNKAANELKERLVNMLGEDGNDIWASTFHSACVRILRRDAEKAGFSSHFTIYDTDDSKRVIKECQRILSIDDKHLSHKAILGEISKAKDSLISPEEYSESASFDPRKAEIAKVYSLYQETLIKADAMDFDDIIVNTVRLLQNNSDVLEYYRNKFRYIMVDEYQDTNHAQYVLVSLLAGGHNNICVVGDDDQSIYSFRGATIENILSFESQFRDAKVIRLEENYRSTQTILDAANAVIANNSERKGKNLWTSNGEGEKITLHTCADDVAEGVYVANSIMNYTGAFSDNAVLYRTNAQSNNIERAFVRAGVPYRIIGGHRFYERKEIKDALAYLAVVSNKNDNVRLRRIINEPKRGIGDTTVNYVSEIAARTGSSMFDIMASASEYALLSKSAGKLGLFTEMISFFAEAREKMSIAELFKTVMIQSGYIKGLENDPETKDDRIENLDELYSTIARYEEENGEDATLEGFLEEVALISDIDNYNAELDTVILMTLHSAKGLEFPNVYLVGMENGLFPSAQSLSEPFLLEEERRLAYVGITRAKKKLYLLNAACRMQYGRTTANPPSCFLNEIPSHLIENTTPRKSSSSSSYQSSARSSSYGNSYGGGYSGYSKSYSSYDYDYSYSSSKPASSYSQKINVGSSINKKNEAPIPDIKAGDTVLHKKFGKGLVLTATVLGNDLLTEVAFDTCGTKKLMAKAARLEKL